MTKLPILLPQGYLPTVKLADMVKSGDVIAQKEAVIEEIINLAEKLEISPRSVGKYLKKSPGENVEIGDTLAEKSSFFSKVKVQSKMSGRVDRYIRESGSIVLVAEDSDEAGDEITSPLEGKVTALSEQVIEIETDKNVLPALKGVGGINSGEIFVLSEKGSEDMLYKLDAGAIDKIVLASELKSDVLMKALGIGVSGIIVERLSEEDFVYFAQREKNTPLLLIEPEVAVKIKKAKNVFVNGEEKVVVLLG